MNIRRLVISFFAVVIALGSFSLSFSVAWFASGSTAYVDAINVTMKTDRRLRISKTDEISDIEAYDVDTLTYDDLTKTKLFSPVSSMFKNEWISEKSDKPHFYNYENALTKNGEPYVKEVNNVFAGAQEFNNFYSEELYLICDDDVYVTLDVENTFVNPNTEYNAQVAKEVVNQNRDYFEGYNEEEIAGLLNQLIRSIRISFLVKSDDYYQYVIYDPYKEGDTLLGGRLDVDKDRYFDTHNYNSVRYETIYGEIEGDRHADNYFDEKNSEDIVPSDTHYSSFNAISKEGARPFNRINAINDGLVIAEEGALSSTEIDQEIGGLKIPVYYNKPSKFVLSIYLEGWDLDCVNTVMGANFLSQIQFKILREM